MRLFGILSQPMLQGGHEAWSEKACMRAQALIGVNGVPEAMPGFLASYPTRINTGEKAGPALV
jgi:hypothetical protein